MIVSVTFSDQYDTSKSTGSKRTVRQRNPKSRTVPLAKEVVFDNALERIPTVFNAYLLTFRDRTTMIRNRDFAYANTKLADFRGDFRTKAKAILFHLDSLEN